MSSSRTSSHLLLSFNCLPRSSSITSKVVPKTAIWARWWQILPSTPRGGPFWGMRSRLSLHLQNERPIIRSLWSTSRVEIKGSYTCQQFLFYFIILFVRILYCEHLLCFVWCMIPISSFVLNRVDTVRFKSVRWDGYRVYFTFIFVACM